MHIRRAAFLIIVLPFLVAAVAAYAQWAIVGLPPVPAGSDGFFNSLHQQGFPLWIGITHYINLFFIILLIRSGLQILLDHPRLYWNVGCQPGTEWIRFTPVKMPPPEVEADRVWTAKDDARYLSPWIGLPGGRHTLGMSRHWHFLSVIFWVGNGAVYIALLFIARQWRRLVPTSWHILPEAWAIFVHYVTFHLPAEPNTFWHYNALQQLSYFAVVFILAPISILTGPSMSPALVNRFTWYPRLPGNRQIGRSIHFLGLCGYIAFIVAHVSMVVISGFARNMNHIVRGTDDMNRTGSYLGLAGLGVIVVVNVFANWASWRRSRTVQHFSEAILNPVFSVLLNRYATQTEYTEKDISPYLWINGKQPVSDEWAALVAGGFSQYRLKVYGLVEHPVELSLEDIYGLGKKSQITLHNCIQGWSGIAAWGGLQMLDLMALVKPKPQARVAIFYSFGEGGEGGQYYDSHTIANLRHPQALLAYEMNFQPLTIPHGAPLRLRAENELGFKMVKWIQAIEFVENVKPIYKGEGGYAEDNEFFGSMANI
jgi:DMSO/TMAO reductase YedYZ molybdopterin-dependent catalytic subunit/thiosulfate reductase cytochrome b subunit